MNREFDCFLTRDALADAPAGLFFLLLLSFYFERGFPGISTTVGHEDGLLCPSGLAIPKLKRNQK